MGLDTSHDCWHGAYSAFMRWRCKIAEVAGLPPLELMEGFYEKGSSHDPFYKAHLAPDDDREWWHIKLITQSLPIKWSVLKKDPLHELLYHSDCDGKLRVAILTPLANRLEELIPLLPDGPSGGHIWDWKGVTRQFVKGLRKAAKEKKPVIFR